MEIIIHRGTHQIGGCATEYRTANTRIFIDFGAELDVENARTLDIKGVTNGISDCDGVFFTHYHGDHIGLLDAINKDIPLYMGEASKGVVKILNDRLSKAPDVKSYDKMRIDSIQTFKVALPITVGDIKVTPFLVDHSAYDAYMFKIEAGGKTVLHTGDFRVHGFRGKGMKKVLDKYVKKVDALVCEGTTLNRTEVVSETENELTGRIKNVLEKNKYVFIVCSSTNIDRLAGICAVIPEGKYCICDKYQLSVLDYITEVGGKYSDLYKFEKVLYYGENLDEKMEDRGFCMFVRCGNPEHKRIMEKYKNKKPIVIYSMWKGYLQQENFKKFFDGYSRFDMHTSGHAGGDAIKMVIDSVKPDVIIPMHTEVPEKFVDIAGDICVILTEDKKVIKI